MATIITTEAQIGYERDTPNPYLRSSANWFAFEAGRAMDRCGYTRPIKATMGRGYQVNVWTAANRFRVAFDAHLAPIIDRLG